METWTWGLAVPHIFTLLCKCGGTDESSQVDMHTCTDTFTHPNHGMTPEEG